MNRTRVATLLLMLVAAACADDPAPFAPEYGGPQYEIDDGAHLATNPHFFFLPPMVPAPGATGIFDPSLDPTVLICEWSGSACALPPIATFTMATGTGGETVQVDLEQELYHVNWHTKRLGLDAAKTYRILVEAGGVTLGHADVDVVNTGKELKKVDRSSFIPLKAGRTLPTKFRIEEGAIPSTPRGRIAFQSNRDGNFELYYINADGTGLTRITNSSAKEIAPRWSPDGSKLLFISDRDGARNAHTINPDGTGEVRITSSTSGLDVSSWSPDGLRIAFPQAAGGSNIFVQNVDGTNLQQVTFSATGEAQPDWSPDGLQLVYQSQKFGTNLEEIYVINVDGTGETRLTNAPGPDIHAVWSPEGTRIAFSSRRDGIQRIYVMDADGGNQTPITGVAGSLDLAPYWSPDGEFLVFNRQTGGVYDIYIVRPDGTDLHILYDASVSGGTNNAIPSWTTP